MIKTEDLDLKCIKELVKKFGFTSDHTIVAAKEQLKIVRRT